MLVNLDFCSLELFDNYVICIVNEGETVCEKNSAKQTKFLLNYFKEKPFVYITNRINSYSVDPLIYNTSSKITSLLGFGVITYDTIALNTIEIEKPFFKGKPFKTFEDINDAINWAKTLTLKILAN